MTYDCFTFFNELDLLEIRLSILDKDVDHFILVESPETFSGKPKPLYYEENKERFAKWNHKIIHLVMPLLETNFAFDRHYLCYDAIEKEIQKRAQPEDTVYCSDLDEIWKPQEVVDDKIYSLKQLNHCYYLNMRSSEEWVGTLVSRAKNVIPGYNKIHRTKKEHILENGGWHFTNQGGADQIRKKLEAYDHTEFNQADIKDGIEAKMKYGVDFVGRSHDWQGKPFEFWVDESELPQYLVDNKQTWIHLFQS